MAKDKENKPTDAKPRNDVDKDDAKVSQSDGEAGNRNRDTQQISKGDKATNVVTDGEVNITHDDSKTDNRQQDINQNLGGNKATSVVSEGDVNVTHDDSKTTNISSSVFALIAMAAVLVIVVGMALYFANRPIIKEEGEQAIEKSAQQSDVPVADMEARIAYDRRLLTNMIEQIESVKRGLGKNLSYGKFEEAETDLKDYKFSQDSITDKNTAILAFVRGGIHFLEHEYDDAARFYEEAVENASKDYLFEYLSQLGTTQLELGLYDEALKTFEDAIVASNSEEEKATGNNNLGKALWFIGDDLDSAIAAFEDALEIRKIEDGLEHELVGSIYNNLAVAYDDYLKCNEAQEKYKAALDIYKEALGDLYDKSREVANTLSNKATSLESIQCKERKNLTEQQRLAEEAEAKQNLKEAIEIRTRIVGENHPSVAMDYCNLSTLLWNDPKVTDKTEAMELHNKCRDIFIETLPDSHQAITEASVELRKREDILENK